MSGNALSGVGYVLRGMRLLTSPALRPYVALPVVVNVSIFALLITWAVQRFVALVDWTREWLPGWLHWVEWLFWPLLVVSLVLAAAYGFTLLANLIGAPFNGLLAEATERHLTGTDPPAVASWRQLLVEAPRAVVAELEKLWYQVRWAVLALLVLLIPGFNLLAPVLWVLFSAWMLAVEYFDYPLSARGMRPAEQRALLRGRRAEAMSFGLGAAVLSALPVLNLVAMPACVVGATALCVERWWND